MGIVNSLGEIFLTWMHEHIFIQISHALTTHEIIAYFVIFYLNQPKLQFEKHYDWI